MRLLVFTLLVVAIVGGFVYANVAQRRAVESIVAQRGSTPQATVDLNCDRASHLAKQAWSATADPSARYDAATAGLGVINACQDPDQRTFGGAMLMAVKTDAEFKLKLGNAIVDAKQAVLMLKTCEEQLRETLPAQSAQCAQNRKALETYLR